MKTDGLKAIQPNQDRLPAQAAEKISQLIIDRHLKAGDRIPTEHELASQLNVGRGTLREAVKLLESRNILEIRRGVGTFVANRPGQIDDPLGFAYYPDQKALMRDLLEVRLQLEPWVARVAAMRASEDDLKRVQETCHSVEEDILAHRDHIDHDMAFHVEIARCTQNVVVPKLIPIISYSVGLSGSIIGTTLLTDTIVCHRAIADAISAGDGDTAERMMRRHLEQNRQELERVIPTL